MCGFAGIVNFTSPQPPAIDEALLRRMGEPVAHRGPDGAGTFISPDGRVGLIHYRLAIVDVPGGAQPMSNEDGAVWVVFNGEIYNHVELRAELEGLGHRFKTDHCDTEVIVHAYEEFGRDCPRRFRGQFAFAVVDLKQKQVFLARDRLGQKPLYFTSLSDGSVLFGSSSRCLSAHPETSFEIAPAQLVSYLSSGYVSWSVFGQVSQCGPGRWAWVELRNGESVHCEETFWWPANTGSFGGGLAQAEAAVRQRLVEATEFRLRADVEVGLFLSGGTDSAVVASIVRRVLDKPIRTFTVGTPDPAYDERESAQRTADALGTEHQEFVVEPDHLLDVLDDLVETVGEPFADSSIVPTYWVAKLTRPHVKVALSGDGGDECFGGYDRYRAVRLHSRLRCLQWLWQLTWPVVRRVHGNSLRSRSSRLRRFVDGGRRSLPRAYQLWTGLFEESQIRRLLTACAEGHTALTLRRALLDASFLGRRDRVQAACQFDMLHYLPHDILTKVDRASMRAALEVRSPFLDHKVAELALSLPSRWKLRGRRSKWILREAFKDIVPPHVWTQPKRGFALPLDRWFRGELLPLLRESVGCLPPDVFNHAYIDELIARHQGGREEHSQRLWALLWLGRWWKRFM